MKKKTENLFEHLLAKTKNRMTYLPDDISPLTASCKGKGEGGGFSRFTRKGGGKGSTHMQKNRIGQERFFVSLN